jgi:hypothetical protein
MPREQYSVEIFAPPEKVFAHMDDINNVGWHMSTESSMVMMGSRLVLEVIDDREGVGATYRWKGSIMGMAIDIKETVTKWAAGREKDLANCGEAQDDSDVRLCHASATDSDPKWNSCLVRDRLLASRDALGMDNWSAACKKVCEVVPPEGVRRCKTSFRGSFKKNDMILPVNSPHELEHNDSLSQLV